MAFESPGTEPNQINPTEWAARTAAIRDGLADDEQPDTTVIAALGSFRFRDDQGRLWSYTGATWWMWDSQQWTEMAPPATLSVDPYKFSGTAKFARTIQPTYVDAGAATAVAAVASGAAAATDAADVDQDLSDGGSAEAAAMDATAAADASSLAVAAATEADVASEQAVTESAAATDAATDVSGIPEDAEPTEAESTDAEATVAEPTVLEAEDTEPADAEPVDAEPVDTEPSVAVDGTIPSMDVDSDDRTGGVSSPTTDADLGTDVGAEVAGVAAYATTADDSDTSSVGSTELEGATAIAGELLTSPDETADNATPVADAAVIGSYTSFPESQPVASPAAAAAIGAAAVAGAAVSEPQSMTSDFGASAAAAAASPASDAEDASAAIASPAAEYAQPDAQASAAAAQAQYAQAAAVSYAAAQPAAAQPAPAPTPSPQPAYRPTHVVPPAGMPAWPQPDPRLQPQFHLAPGLDAMVAEWLPSGWARIICSNGWSGWVDGRQLVPYGQPAGQQR